jgi:chromosome partitioning protein
MDLPIQDVLLETEVPGLSLVPSGQRLAAAEVELVDADRREFRLKEALGAVEDRFDFILIDAPPSLGFLTVNALTGAKSVLVPVQCEYYALEGPHPPAGAIRSRATEFESNPSDRGGSPHHTTTASISPSRCSRRRGGSSRSGSSNRDPAQREAERSAELQKPVVIYDPGCAGSTSYINLAREVIERG